MAIVGIDLYTLQRSYRVYDLTADDNSHDYLAITSGRMAHHILLHCVVMNLSWIASDISSLIWIVHQIVEDCTGCMASEVHINPCTSNSTKAFHIDRDPDLRPRTMD